MQESEAIFFHKFQGLHGIKPTFFKVDFEDSPLTDLNSKTW